MDRVPRWIFLILTIGVLVWSLHNVRWETRYTPPLGYPRFTISRGTSPLWAPPSEMTIAEFRETWSWADARPQIVESGRVELLVNWEMALGGFAAIWVIFGGLLWPVFRLGARWEPSWGRAARFSLGLLTGCASCFVLWLVFGGWGPPSPLFFALLGVFLGWRWSRRAPVPCES